MKNKVVFKMKLKKRKCLAVILVLTLLLSLLPSNLFLKAEKVIAASSAPTGNVDCFYANGTPITIEASAPGDATPGSVSGYTQPDSCTAYIVWSIGGIKYYVGIKSGSYRIYGGSNTDLTANTSITMNGGSVGDIYGGNYNSNLTGNTSIVVNGGSLFYLYGGCGGSTGSVSGNSGITFDNAVAISIYGGNCSYSADANISNTTVNIKSGSFSNVYGGNCGNGKVTGNTTVNISGGHFTNIYGGGSSGYVYGDTTVNVSGGSGQNIYGGGLDCDVNGNTNINISGGSLNSIYAGGSEALEDSIRKVKGNATLNITGGTVLGGARKGRLNTNSTAKLYISGGSVNGPIYDMTPVVSAQNNTQVVGYTLTFGSSAAGQAVSKLVATDSMLGYSYGMKGVKTNSSKQIKVYLPEGKTQVLARDNYGNYYCGNIVSSSATMNLFTPSVVNATLQTELTTATGTVVISLSPAVADLSENNIVVSKDGAALTYGTDYTLSGISTTSASITFAASAGLNYSSDVTVLIEKWGYDIFTSPITLINKIPAVPPYIATTSLSNATIGTAYSQSLTATGDAPFSWSVDSGSLPAGLTLSGNTISGTPTTAGSYPFRVRATNSGGSDTQELTITVDPITVTSFDLSSLITAPVKGQTPSTTAIDATQYTGTVSWSPSTASFEGGTAYTASVTLTPKTNYTFNGVAANSFTCSGASSSNSVNSGIVTIEFPATSPKELNSITVNHTPTKTTYSSGESFEPAGLSLTLHYDDGTTPVVTYSDATKASFSFNKSSLITSDTAVQITYGGRNVSQSITVNPAKVTLNNLSALITAPVRGQTPNTAAIDTAQYTGTVSWSPAGAKFADSTVYTATVTLTAKSEYTFTGVPANSFTCTGATSVSNSADSGTVSVVFPVTEAKVVNDITVKNPPTKTTYVSGESFNPSGLVLTLNYDDSTTADVTYSDATKASFSFNKSSLTTSDTAVQITYSGKNVSQSITVNRTKATLKDLSALITAPVRGQAPNTTAIDTVQYSGTVTWNPVDAKFADSTVYTATVTLTAKAEYTFSGVAANSFTYTGATGVTNAANSGTVSISFPATAAKVLSSITVKNAPSKVKYESGDSFNPAGLVLTLHYDDSTTADVNYSDATKADFSFNKTAVAVSDKEIQITYKGKNINQAIMVNEKTATPTATPTTPANKVSTAPAAPNPTFTTQTIVNSNNSVALSGSMVSGISLNVVPIPTTDADYTGMKKLIGNNEVLGAFHVTVTGGSYQGNLNITFTVGNRYNLRNAIILHKKQNGTIETLSGIVKNGKVTVTVSELSPFVIMVQPVKSVPKTGDTTSNLPLIMVAIFSAIGFTAFLLNRKRKSKDAK